MFSNNFLETLDYQNFDAKIKISSFPVKPPSTRVNLSIETLLEENTPLVIEDTRFKIDKCQKK